MRARTLRPLGAGRRSSASLALVAALAACASPAPLVREQGAWGAEACPSGTRFHRSERYWEEFASWPAQWCSLPDGTRHGPWTEWFEDGHVRRMGLYVNGVPEGRWLAWKEPGWWPPWGPHDYQKIELSYEHGTLVKATRASTE